jgi:glycosyltransferase involved in cell wall biosynthesis/GT2 family glycosyltransferase
MSTAAVFDFADTPVSPGRARFEYRHESIASPVVSIVTPFFNTGEVFEQTAASVLGQSLQQWEWIVVDDGSTNPEALQRLARVAAMDTRIRVLRASASRGPGAARNAGCAAARTGYLLLLDSDDLIEPTAAEKCWWFLESYPEFAFVKGFSVGFGAMEYCAPTGFHDERAFLQDNRADITTIVRRDVWAAAGGFAEDNRDGLEDWEFWLRCADRGYWGGTVPEYLSWYRRRDDHAAEWPNWDAGRGQAAFRARLEQQFPRLYRDNAFPQIRPGVRRPDGEVLDTIPGENRLTKRRPRLLMVVPWCAMGGADRFNLDIARQLTAGGWEVSVATTEQGDYSWTRHFTAISPDVFVLPNFLRLPDYPRFLRYLIGSRRPDAVLVSNSELGYHLLPHLRADAPDAAFVDLCHMQETWRTGGYPRYSIESRSSLDLTITVSAHLRDWMVAGGASSSDVAVCHYGIDVPDPQTVTRERVAERRALRVPDAVPIVLYAGRICAQKRPQLFVETMRQLDARGVPFVAVVAGDGPDLAALRASVTTHGLDRRVRFVGAVAPERVQALVSAADVVFLPSEMEGIALVLFEAMARGVPVVAADVGGQAEVVTSECGVLIPPGATELNAYVAALEELLRDPVRRREAGRHGRERIQREFTAAAMGARVDEYVRRAVARRRSAGPSHTIVLSESAADVVETFAARYAPYWDWVHGRARAAVTAWGWRERLVRSFSLLEPAYAWAVRRGWKTLPLVRRRVRAWIVGRRSVRRATA